MVKQMIKQTLKCASQVITNHQGVIEDIKNEENLKNYFIRSNLAILICSMVFGAVLGSYVGGGQILLNAIKVPILFFITLYISLPIFFILDLLMGSKIKFLQTCVLLLTGYAITAIIALSFAPVILFFLLTAKEYYFTVFITIGIMGFSGYFGIMYIYKNFQLFHGDDKKWLPSVLTGSFIIMLVGTQLSWTLRPFFHSYDRFIRPAQGNFYVELTEGAARHPFIAGPLLLFFIIIAIIITLIMLTKSPKIEQVKNGTTSPKNHWSNPPPYPTYSYPPPNPIPYESKCENTQAESSKIKEAPFPETL
jgi:hypothetical protein